MTEALRLEGVSVRFGELTALDDVSLRLGPGAVVGVVGPNGSGKTTLLDVVSGFVGPSAGRVHIDGRDATRVPSHARAALGVARGFQDARLYATLTVPETVAVAASHGPAGREAVEAFGLDAWEVAYGTELSTGMRRVVELVAAAAAGSRLLLLDEPTAGLAEAEKRMLVRVLKAWRDRTGGALLVVEHDHTFLSELADRVIVLDAGRVVRSGPTAEILSSNTTARAGLAPRPAGAGIRPILDRIEAAGRPEAGLDAVDRRPSLWTLARLGLRQLGAGMLAVLIFGVLNRVMKVELGVALWLVAGIVGVYNLSAPLAVLVGHRSDRRPFAGRYRTPYILGGAAVAAGAAALAPFAAFAVADTGSAPWAVLVMVALFCVMGVGMYGSGTAYFALLADLTTPAGRARAVSVVYSMLMVGILSGVALGAWILGEYEPDRLVSLFGLVAVLLVVLTTLAVWGVEPRRAGPVEARALPFRRALASVVRARQARWFFAFVCAAIFFAFLHQAVLEPFGGDVFGLDVRATTLFNGVLFTGVLLGMGTTGAWLAPRLGKQRTAGLGLAASAVAFAVLAGAALTQTLELVYLGIFALGVGLGVLNVGALSLMMDMTTTGLAGLSMGLWTVAHAAADGLATAGGGLIHGIALAAAGSEPGAYAAVFATSAVGLLATLVLLRRINIHDFHAEVRASEPA